MRSLYKRQLTMMVGVMVLSFTLLSTAFMLLSYRYIISEKRDAWPATPAISPRSPRPVTAV